jgi:site-specific DNA-cytosine methylase
MNILQLCCFTNLWGPENQVESIDLKNGKDVFDLPDDYGKNFDLVCAAPPCDQFTRASSWMWLKYPDNDIQLVNKCLKICLSTGKFWFLENPPGRIESFIPELKKYRITVWTGCLTGKQYVIYGNFVFLSPRYKRKSIIPYPRKKELREAWQSDLIENIKIFI